MNNTLDTQFFLSGGFVPFNVFLGFPARPVLFALLLLRTIGDMVLILGPARYPRCLRDCRILRGGEIDLERAWSGRPTGVEVSLCAFSGCLWETVGDTSSGLIS